MIVIPAIDLIDGKVVRLKQGRYDQKTVYGEDPIETARIFKNEGAVRIHVVDLEAARLGQPKEKGLIQKLVQTVQAEFQVGGGIRDAETVQRYLRMGVKRVVLGTRASLDKGFLREVLGAFSESTIIAIDAVEGKCATHGWTQSTNISADELADQVQQFGGREILYTDIPQDGMMKGVNTQAVTHLIETTSLGVIASGGVSTIDDIKALVDLKLERLVGVITGKAIYEGRLSLKDAVGLC